MNIANIALIFVVIVVAVAAIVYMLRKNKAEIVEDSIQVDDKTFTLDKMVKFVKQRLDEITKINLYDIGLSEEELKRRRAKKYELKKALKGCTYGDVNDKKYVKELIFDLLEKEYGVTETNISKAIPFDIPSLLTGMASISCIVGAGRINSKRNAALATAYSISEKALLKYRDKVIETIGEKKEKEIRNKVAQEEVNDNPVSKSHIIVTSKGNTLCMDTISGRYFKSDIDTIKKIVNELNRDMMYQNYISLDEFYSKIGLPSIKNGSHLGWNIDNGFIEIDFGAALTEEGEPCLVLDFERGPEYDFNKLS